MRIFKVFRFFKFIKNIDKLISGVMRSLKTSILIIICFIICIFLAIPGGFVDTKSNPGQQW